MRVGVPNEIYPGERRVAATPQSVKRLRKLGFEVQIERGAGESADYPDANYVEAGATIVDDVEQLWATSDIVLKMNAPEQHVPHRTDTCSWNRVHGRV